MESYGANKQYFPIYKYSKLEKMKHRIKNKKSNFLYTLLCDVIGKSPLRSKTRTEEIIQYNDKIFKIIVSEGGRKAYVFEIKTNNEFYILKYNSVIPIYTLNSVIRTIVNSNQNLTQAFRNHLISP